jgi:hypothetical protein
LKIGNPTGSSRNRIYFGRSLYDEKGRSELASRADEGWPTHTFLKPELVGKIDENILNLFLGKGDISFLGPSGLQELDQLETVSIEYQRVSHIRLSPSVATGTPFGVSGGTRPRRVIPSLRTLL